MNLLRMAMVATLCSVAATSATNAGTICRSTGFVGFEAQAQRAVAVLGPPTTDMDKARLYVEAVGTGFYYQTNYREPGAAFPAKLLSPTEMPLTLAIANLIFPNSDAARRGAATTAALAQRLAGTQFADVGQP